jgi:hypothetical protein
LEESDPEDNISEKSEVKDAVKIEPTEERVASKISSKIPYVETPKSGEKEKSVPMIQRRYFGGKTSNNGSIENLDALGEDPQGEKTGIETQPASKMHRNSNIENAIAKNTLKPDISPEKKESDGKDEKIESV